jgi:hypothetical protein
MSHLQTWGNEQLFGMKKCGHCGCENPDEATNCSGCGKPTLETGISSTDTGDNKQDQRSFQKNIGLRLIIAGCVWLLISGISIHVAWKQSGHSIAWFEQWRTQGQLESIAQAIGAYKIKYNTSPTNFEQLQQMTNEAPEMAWLLNKGFYDGWNRPFILSNEHSNCLVISYGADGKPGGEGIDFDLTSENPKSEESAPTFRQFWGNQLCSDMIHWCFICGGMAALLSLFTVRVPDLTERGVVILILSLGATFVSTLFITSIITALHIPSGH